MVMFQPSVSGVMNNEEGDTETRKYVENDLLHKLECGICLETVDKPRKFCDAGHLFCQSCTESTCKAQGGTPRCPTCRRDVLMKDGEYGAPPDPLVDAVMQNLEVKCPNGCDCQMKCFELKQHSRSCPLKTVSCNYCGIKMARNAMQNHMEDNATEHLLMAQTYET